MCEQEIPNEIIELLRKHSWQGKDLRLYMAIAVKHFDFIQTMTPAQAEIFITDTKAAVS